MQSTMLVSGKDLIDLVNNSFETDELQRIFDLEIVGERIVANSKLLTVSVRKPNYATLKFMRIEITDATGQQNPLNFVHVSPAKLGIEESFEFELQEAKKLALYPE